MNAVIFLFCVLCSGSNSAFLRVVRCRSLSEEYGLNTFNKDEISKVSFTCT